MGGKGGARHLPKPQIDAELLKAVLVKQKDVIKSFGPYENISRNQACNPRGLVHVLPMVKEIVKLENSAEIHQACLRTALYSLYQDDPSINDSKFNGGVWINQRVERINCILYHFRRLRNAEDLRTCASKLTSLEFKELQQVVEEIDKKPDTATLSRNGTLDKRESKQDLVKRESPEDEENEVDPNAGPSKKLKKEVSDVSLDSDGWPKMFQSPPKLQNEGNKPNPLPKGDKPLKKGDGPSPKGEEADPNDTNALPQPSFMRRRVGQMLPTKESDQDLQEKMGLTKKKKAPTHKKVKAVMKKPGASLKKPAASGSVQEEADPEPLDQREPSGSKKPWLKLRKTKGNKPERAYITGTNEVGSNKLKLIVEISKKRSDRYEEHIDKIMKELEEKHLSKEEALKLREDLCNQD